jgi:hypothetical protein
MKRGSYPFRGAPQPRAVVRQRVKIRNLKRDVERRQKRGKKMFALMLRYWNTESFDNHTKGGNWWKIMRDYCSAKTRLRRYPTQSIARERILASDWRVPF